MATKKQRRRRSKERRHEWEYVYVDDEGQEVEVEEDEAPAKPTRSQAKATKQPSGRGGRKVDPPSWSRVGKRALIFAPLMFVVVFLLQGKHKSVPAAVLQTLVLLAFFLPFSYFMDRMMYRSALKRMGRGDRAKPR